MEHRQKSLVICLTPLQMLIAEKIIEKNINQEFDLLVISLFDNEKYRYYFNRLKESVNVANYYIYHPSNKMKNLKNFLNFKNFFKTNYSEYKNYKNYYLASIDSRHCQWILSLAPVNCNLYTFDDGTANIFPNSIYYVDKKNNLLTKIFLRLQGVKLMTLNLKNISKKHFTIYHNIPNAFNNVENISLFSNIKNAEKSKKRVIKILLGQPLYEISSELDYDYVNKVIKNLNIDHYFPHPRENLTKFKNINNVEILKTDLIFEDFVVDFMRENSDVALEIYSFTSSAAINCSGLDGVNVFFIFNDIIDSENSSIYLILKKIGFNFLIIN
ncbi:MAG: glycosyltransferase family 52 [Acinetobacter johnsonii]